jgi:hypothetical protein
MGDLIKTEKEDFHRNCENHALINTNVSAYARYVENRKSLKKVSNVEGEITSLKRDVQDIKELLGVLIKQISKEN